MKYSIKYGLLVLSSAYMISILFPSMVIAATVETSKQYKCKGRYGDKVVFDQIVTAANMDDAFASVLQAVKNIVKEGNYPPQRTSDINYSPQRIVYNNYPRQEKRYRNDCYEQPAQQN